MEIHARETARAILHHIHEPNQKFRDDAHASEAEFQAYSRQYEELVENAKERQLGHKVFRTYSEFKALGDQLLDISSERRENLHTLRSDDSNIDQALMSISERFIDGQTSNEAKKLAAVLRMEVEIEKAFAVVEAYTAMHDPEMKDELTLATRRFQRHANDYRATNLSAVEQQGLAELENQLTNSVTAAQKAISLTDKLTSISSRFESDLVEMDRVLDDNIQPIIHAETVRAAEDAMNSSRRAISLLACLSVLGVMAGGFLGWHI